MFHTRPGRQLLRLVAAHAPQAIHRSHCWAQAWSRVTVSLLTSSRIMTLTSPLSAKATAVSELLWGSIPMVITGLLPVAGDGEPRDGQPDLKSDHASVEPRRGRATAGGTLWVSQPGGGKKRPSQPTVALGTLWAADPAA
jgi:hypothetical protein